MSENIMLTYEKGLANTPSDILSEDGMLSECVNLEVKNGELVPMEMPVKLGVKLDASEKLVLVHKTKTGVKTYVTLSEGVLKFRNAENGILYGLTVNVGEIASIQYIGNTIVAYSATSSHYINYGNDEYKYLGNSLPEIEISFDLNGEFVLSDVFDLEKGDDETTDNEDKIIEQLITHINSFISTKATAENKFMYPFLVRYAIRLYDGSYCKHSAPVLMLPSTYASPVCFSEKKSNTIIPAGSYDTQLGAYISSLHAKVNGITGNMSDWKDIVSSVDIFVTSQIYTYDQNGTQYGGIYANNDEFVGSVNGVSSVWSPLKAMIESTELNATSIHQWRIPLFKIEETYAKISSASIFYRFASFSVGDLSRGDTFAVAGDTPLSGLEVMETLPDDYMTHDMFVPKSSFVYNGRLHISNINRQLFKGFAVHCMSNLVRSESDFAPMLQFGEYDAYVYIRSKDGGEDIIVKSESSEYGALFCNYVFYPDTDAYKMVLHDKRTDNGITIPLWEHPLLNGACGFSGFDYLWFTDTNVDISPNNNTEKLRNKLYTSEVNNPFYFPLNGVYTVGTEEIIGMAAVTRPISQGQFGEYPFMVFCSDGNFALRVSNEGYYETISPMQEDIVLGFDKITPLENSVAIVTKKGLMVSSGGDMVHHASLMNGKQMIKSSLPGLDSQSHSYLIGSTSDTESFLEYLYGSRMAFDYASNRLFINNADKDYSYVYNFDSGTTSKIVIGNGLKIISSAIDYPDVVLEDNAGNLYSLYDKMDVNSFTDHRLGFAITKCLKLGSPFNLKSVKQVKNIANVSSVSSYVRYGLYGSNDNMTYYKIASRYGKPYKYYRIALYTNLLPKDAFIGTALEVEERRTNKLR